MPSPRTPTRSLRQRTGALATRDDDHRHGDARAATGCGVAGPAHVAPATTAARGDQQRAPSEDRRGRRPARAAGSAAARRRPAPRTRRRPTARPAGGAPSSARIARPSDAARRRRISSGRRRSRASRSQGWFAVGSALTESPLSSDGAQVGQVAAASAGSGAPSSSNTLTGPSRRICSAAGSSRVHSASLVSVSVPGLNGS